MKEGKDGDKYRVCPEKMKHRDGSVQRRIKPRDNSVQRRLST